MSYAVLWPSLNRWHICNTQLQLKAMMDVSSLSTFPTQTFDDNTLRNTARLSTCRHNG
jgi:hypothetical protein